MSKAPFARVVAAVATPFHRDDRVDQARLLAHCRWLLAEGCDGLVLFGSTGEAPSLTLAERFQIIEHLLANGVPASRLLIGSGSCALEDTVALTKFAVSSNCAGALLVPPYFFKDLTDEGIRRYYDQVIERVADDRLALYLYHYPQVSAVPLPPSLVRQIVQRHPQVIRGYKDSSGDWTNTEAMLREFPQLEIFTSNEARLTDTLKLGGAGVISATANVQPRAIRAVVEEALRGAAPRSQGEVAACRVAFQGLPIVAAVKAVLATIHNDAAWHHLRAPLSPIANDVEAKLLKAIGL
jgi:4-hydroxy-tetrahydrodipicolinate synthase